MKRDTAEQAMELEHIEELIRVLEQSEVSELTIRKDDWGVTIRKGRPPVLVRPSVAPPAAEEQACPAGREEDEPEQPVEVDIVAPMVGIFHTLEQGPKEGDSVQPGQVVGIIESMKLMNDVRSDAAGVVVAIVAEDGTPVEYGQPLFRLRQAPAVTDKEGS